MTGLIRNVCFSTKIIQKQYWQLIFQQYRRKSIGNDRGLWGIWANMGKYSQCFLITYHIFEAIFHRLGQVRASFHKLGQVRASFHRLGQSFIDI